MGCFSLFIRNRAANLFLATIAVAMLIPSFALAGDEFAGRKDLRDLRVGMTVSQISGDGYVNLRCAAEPHKTVTSWSSFGGCKADEQGRHAIRFEFDEKSNVLGPLDDKYRGTMVGGHPVLLTLLISDDNRVVGLDVETNDQVRLFLRKKAHMLGKQAMSYYGQEGWTCTNAPPTADKAPIGTSFIHERCNKRSEGREVIVYRKFYRLAHAELKDFVSATKFEVRSLE